MRHQRQKKLCVAAAVACCAGVVGVALADDIPFWDGGSSMPTRTPASASASVAAASLDSRTVQTAESTAVTFDSDSKSGLCIIFR